MSRASAGIGSGLGAVAGSIAGFYVNRYARLTRDTPFAEIIGAVAGAIIGGAVGADSCSTKQPGTVGALSDPRFP